MNAKTVCSVMLFSYNALEKRCKAIDKAIYSTALHSARKNTLEVCMEIERLTNEKIAYINTKIAVEKALATLNRTYEIEHHHFKGESIEQIASTLNEKWVTIERRLSRQRARLYEVMQRYNSAEELFDIISGSEWLMSRYKRELRQKL